MKTPELMVCKGFLERCPPQVKSGLVQLLSREDQLNFHQLPSPIPLEGEHLKWNLLDHIHYSWLAPYLRTLTEPEIRLFLAALSKEQVLGLQKLLGVPDHFPSLTKVAKEAFRDLLLRLVKQKQDLIPFAFLPVNSLNRLLALSHAKLNEVIRYLGLHDLSFEMRQIIATAQLKKIFAVLSKKEGEYLNQLMLHKEPLIFKRLFLQNWDGSKKELHKLIEERGLHRLGHAVYGAHDSFIWYLTHLLEIHQGTLLLKYKEKPAHERAEKILMGQIEKISEFLKSKGVS